MKIFKKIRPGDLKTAISVGPKHVASIKKATASCGLVKNLLQIIKIFAPLKKNFMAPFYGWSSTASRLEPLRGGSLLFTTKSSEIPGTHFIDLGRMKG